MDLELGGSTALITGGSRGIGFATARVLCAEGCSVAIVGRTSSSLDEARRLLTESSGAQVLAIHGDMGVVGDIERAIKTVAAELGPIDALVACAAGVAPGAVDELSADDWLNGFRTKVMGYVFSCRAVLADMKLRRRGRIVLVAGASALHPGRREALAAAVNAADRAIVESLAEEGGSFGIGVNSVDPGPIDTDRWSFLEAKAALASGRRPEDLRAATESSIALGRLGTPEEVANVIAFLVSPRSRYVTGAHITVDGFWRPGLTGSPAGPA